MEEGIPFKAFLFMAESAKAEIRRFTMEKPFIGKLRPLKAKLRDVYPSLKMKTFTVAWKDEDEDEVLVSSDDEVVTMCQQAHDAVIKLVVRCTGVKFDVTDDIAENTEATAADAKPIKSVKGSRPCLHLGITCDHCGNAVFGFRYKCITCDNYDLCVRCEKNGQHPDHCVVRLPVPNMPLPIIKASIKKSRRFLKSIASQAHEDSKKQRRERNLAKYGVDANTINQGKQDSQTGGNRNWIDVCSHYLDEFANLAGNLHRMKPETKSTEPGSSKAGTAEPANDSSEENEPKPWTLPENDMDKLEHACKFLSQYTSVAPLMDDITAADATAAQSSARAASPKMDGPPAKQEVKEQTAETCQQDVLEAVKHAMKVLKDIPNANQMRTKSSKSKKVKSSESVAKSGKRTADKIPVVKGSDDELSASEILEAARNLENSSNSSSCSCLSNNSDKADDWTVIEDCESRGDMLKDKILEAERAALMGEELKKKIFAVRTSIYPDLNSATAVLNPNQTETADDSTSAAASAPAAAPAPAAAANTASAKTTASAPPMTDAKTAQEPTQPKAKPAQAKPKPNAQTLYTDTTVIDQLAPHIAAAVRQMEAMGFSNESGWLSQLLGHNDGNIANVLDLITPVVPQQK